jgi:hypothetical protein
MGNTVTWQLVNTIGKNITYGANSSSPAISNGRTEPPSPSGFDHVGFSTSTKAGIGVGFTVALILIVALIFLLFHLNRQRTKKLGNTTVEKVFTANKKKDHSVPPMELPIQFPELPDRSTELPGTTPELPRSELPGEGLEASDSKLQEVK